MAFSWICGTPWEASSAAFSLLEGCTTHAQKSRSQRALSPDFCRVYSLSVPAAEVERWRGSDLSHMITGKYSWSLDYDITLPSKGYKRPTPQQPYSAASPASPARLQLLVDNAHLLRRRRRRFCIGRSRRPGSSDPHVVGPRSP